MSKITREEAKKTMQSLIYELTVSTDEAEHYGIKQKNLSELVEMLTIINNFINQQPTPLSESVEKDIINLVIKYSFLFEERYRDSLVDDITKLVKQALQPNKEQLRDEIVREILKIEDVESFTRFEDTHIFVDGNTFCYRTPKGIMFDYDNLTPRLYKLIAQYFELESESNE